MAKDFASFGSVGEGIRHNLNLKRTTERDTNMPRLPSSQPTEVELQILRILWEHGPSTARGIHNQLSGERETNYSTTVKMLSVMLDKKLVKRDETVRPQVFRTVATQDRTQERMLKDLIQKAYDGSMGSLVMQALSSQKSSPDELAEIRRLLNELEVGKK
jgi:BlaI family penicillinase repressor